MTILSFYPFRSKKGEQRVEQKKLEQELYNENRIVIRFYPATAHKRIGMVERRMRQVHELLENYIFLVFK